MKIMKKKISVKVSNSTFVVNVLPAISSDAVSNVDNIFENKQETAPTTKVPIHNPTPKAETAPEIFKSSDPQHTHHSTKWHRLAHVLNLIRLFGLLHLITFLTFIVASSLGYSTN